VDPPFCLIALISAHQVFEISEWMPIADDFAATVRSLFRLCEKETQNFFSAASASLLFLCADETQLGHRQNVGNSQGHGVAHVT
jgi:hypothetical protein